MAQYRTEVVIAADRYVCLQLPAHLPTGRAIVTVSVIPVEVGDEPAPLPVEPTPVAALEPEALPELESDRQDIEWWEEFDEDRERVG